MMMMTDISEGDSSGQRLRRREYRNGGLSPLPAGKAMNGNGHHHGGVDSISSSKRGVKRISNGSSSSSHRYYRVQQQQNYNSTTILLLLFVAIAALIGVFEWLALYKLPGLQLSSLSGESWESELPEGEVAFKDEEDSNDMNDNDPRNYDYVQDDPDKEPILKILRQAGINTTHLDLETYQKLPGWSQIQRLFGTEPRIFGLGENEENCKAFRESTDPTIRFFGIAGAFNSGTNLLASLMIQNCQITERMLVYGDQSKGVRWQVPWGKHTPARYRFDHLTKYDKDVPPSNSLPLITVRDPYQWMQSMCRHPYTVRGLFSERSCPHLVRLKEHNWKSFLPRIGKYVNVRVKYSNTVLHHESLAHFWNDWYQEYMEAEYPRVFVRFEDLLFYGEEVTQKLCKCGGGVPRRPEFMHIQDSAKLGSMAHGHDKTSLLKAILLYGNDLHRLDTYTPEDLIAAREFLDPYLMKLFNYQHPPLPDAAAAAVSS